MTLAPILLCSKARFDIQRIICHYRFSWNHIWFKNNDVHYLNPVSEARCNSFRRVATRSLMLASIVPILGIALLENLRAFIDDYFLFCMGKVLRISSLPLLIKIGQRMAAGGNALKYLSTYIKPNIKGLMTIIASNPLRTTD